MPAEKKNINELLHLIPETALIDVRSPGEYKHAHIPGAISMPLFTDEERSVVGTTYKQQSRQAAIKIGLDFFGPKMKAMVEQAEALFNGTPEQVKTVVVHCWRGGMRSAAVAWLLDLYGFRVITLSGGYKAFRNWVLAQFEKDRPLRILGGYTGSGKTPLLRELASIGQQVLDLEKIANHKGSAFGGIGEESQPSQEMFENIIALRLEQIPVGKEIWVEDESQRIGQRIIPNVFWDKMRSSPVYFLDIPFNQRLEYLVNTYGSFEREKLADSIERIRKRLGGLETKNALEYLAEGKTKECFAILLKYYDKLYHQGLYKRKNYESLLNIIPCPDVNSAVNVTKIALQEA